MHENIFAFLGSGIVNQLKKTNFDGKLSEIRIRVDKPLMIKVGKDSFAVYNGELLPASGKSFKPSLNDIRETMERISQYSFYAFESELTEGYITIPGGHRVGVSGQVVMESGNVKTWRYISGINIRIAHSVYGAADSVIPFIWDKQNFKHTMIISPPGFGKTTLLRDIIRQISNKALTVGLVDERGEVAGSFQGIPQNDVGLRTDVISGCPKGTAMFMLLRAMSPEVIAVDELGGEADTHAVDAVINAGVKLLCTAHGNSLEDARANPLLAPLISRGIFERFIVLGEFAKVTDVLNNQI